MKSFKASTFALLMFSMSTAVSAGEGWTIKVCPGTEATRVGLQSGEDRDKNDVWGEWKSADGVPKEFALPSNQQGFDPIYVQLNNFEEKHVEACVAYDGVNKKHFDFDGKNENHKIKRNESDKCSC